MATNRGCWAAEVSACVGELSREHVVSRTLLSEKKVTVRGFHWCKDDFTTVGVESLVSRCLCRGHNTALSECDAEARRFQDILRWMADGSFGLADGPSRVERVNGLLFARWMAKTVCDLLATDGKHVPGPLASFAFSKTDDPQIRLYLYLGPGVQLQMDHRHIGIYLLHAEENPDGLLASFLFRGMPWVIGTVPLDGGEMQVSHQLGLPRLDPKALLERPGTFQVNVEIPRLGSAMKGRIDFVW